MKIVSRFKRVLDGVEMLTRGSASYYRRRGAKIGHSPVFSRPSMAEPHLCEIGNNV